MTKPPCLSRAVAREFVTNLFAVSFPPGGHQTALRGVHCCRWKKLARQLPVAAAQLPPSFSVLRTSAIAVLVVGPKVAAAAPVSRKETQVISVLIKLLEYDRDRVATSAKATVKKKEKKKKPKLTERKQVIC